MSLIEDRLRLLGFPPRLQRPVAKPDLLAESECRDMGGLVAATRIAREEDAARSAGRETDTWPDPYGPDPIVFGSEPRVAAG